MWIKKEWCESHGFSVSDPRWHSESVPLENKSIGKKWLLGFLSEILN
jgi:hypothetical protein